MTAYYPFSIETLIVCPHFDFLDPDCLPVNFNLDHKFWSEGYSATFENQVHNLPLYTEMHEWRLKGSCMTCPQPSQTGVGWHTLCTI